MLKIKVIIAGDEHLIAKAAEAILAGLKEQMGASAWTFEARRETDGGSRMALVAPTDFVTRVHNGMVTR